jgi:predicted metalloprotease with PDZ domain
MPRPVSHLFEVKMDVRIAPPTTFAYIDFQIPKWQPGRYAVADFAKNVQEFQAMAGRTPLPSMKIDDQTWRVQTGGNRDLTVTYKVFGNDLSGTFAQLDAGHANYNGGEIFMYIAGHKSEPVELRIQPPQGWRVIHGRTARNGELEWRFANYEMLIDNPTEIGPDWTLDEFQADGKTYRVMVHSRGGEGGQRPAFVRDLEKIVRAETAMWGPPDFEQYTFLFHFAADNRSADGMEHLISTQIIEPGTLADGSSYGGALDTAAHEFFHVWNVKRLRPAELGPWDWTRPVHTRNLWIAEGLTNYYGSIMMGRAGLQSDLETLARLQTTISRVENQPGVRLMSAEDSSLAAPFIDGSLHRQRTNLANTSVSYYSKGELIGFVLDLLIRGRTAGRRSLDDVLRNMYDEFYVKSPNATYYLKGRGFTDQDFVRAVSNVVGSDMSGFFTRHVRGVETLPYEEALAHVGLTLAKLPAPRTAGIVMDPADSANLRLGVLRGDSAAELAGLQQGDILLSIGERSVTRANWRAVLNSHREGERVPVAVRRNGADLRLFLVIGAPETYDFVIEEDPSASSSARELRTRWMRGN